MSDKTGIQWTDATWNPVSGCSKVSSGCKNCYAERDWARLSKNPKSPYFGRVFTDVRCHPERLDQPLRWKRPRRIFVNSMSDLFHEDVPFEFIAKVFDVMERCPQHSFQVLTKRADRMADFVANIGGGRAAPAWLGVSVENQAAADERIPILLQTPAAVRFVSVEPMLDAVRLDPAWLRTYRGSSTLNWVIVGGESGPHARACNVEWIRSIVAQCQAAAVPCFVKQVGSRPYIEGPIAREMTWPGLLEDRKGGTPAEWPEDLRVREFPR